MEKRLLKRGETSGRSDDNAESIKKRCAAEAALSGRTVPIYLLIDSGRESCRRAVLAGYAAAEYTAL
jgi:hypothetical protein